ncbi:hypothetical protein NQP46_30550 [Streptomyces albus]|nr:hypothetical protein NQP46_30550 [Streptomyces albus]
MNALEMSKPISESAPEGAEADLVPGKQDCLRSDPAHVSSERRASRCRLHQEAIVDHLFTVMGEAATPIARTGLAAEGLLERQHLQEWVIAHPQVLGESVLVVTAEYDRWADTDGVPRATGWTSWDWTQQAASSWSS